MLYRRVVSFANHDDYISFRHHTYKKLDRGKDVELKEIGPRFQLRWVYNYQRKDLTTGLMRGGGSELSESEVLYLQNMRLLLPHSVCRFIIVKIAHYIPL